MFFNATVAALLVLFSGSGLLCALFGAWTGRSRILCGLLGLAFGPFVALVILSVPPEGGRQRVMSVWAVWLYALAFLLAGAVGGGAAWVHQFGIRPADVAVQGISTTDNPMGLLALFLANFVVFAVGAGLGGQAGMLAVAGLAALHGEPPANRSLAST